MMLSTNPQCYSSQRQLVYVTILQTRRSFLSQALTQSIFTPISLTLATLWTYPHPNESSIHNDLVNRHFKYILILVMSRMSNDRTSILRQKFSNVYIQLHTARPRSILTHRTRHTEVAVMSFTCPFGAQATLYRHGRNPREYCIP